MKIIKIVNYLFLLCLINSLHAVEINDTKALEIAWNHAFEGNNSLALGMFQQAAHQGSWQAAKFLAYNYRIEPLIDEMNIKKSEEFSKLAQNIKLKSNAYFSKYEVESQIQKLKALQFANKNSWFKQILEELNSSASKWMHVYPLPDDGILKLFERINSSQKVDENVRLKQLQLFQSSIKHIQSKDTLCAIFKCQNSNHRVINSFSDEATNYLFAKQIVHSLHGEAIKYGLLDELRLTYRTSFSNFYGDWLGVFNRVEKALIVDSVLELFPFYAELDRPGACKSLTYFLDNSLGEYGEINHNFLRLLRLLSNEEISAYISDTLKLDHLKDFVEALVKNPQEAQALKGTTLDIDDIISDLLKSNLEKASFKAFKALEVFFQDAKSDLYQKHEQSIIAVLPNYAAEEVYNYRTFIILMTQRSCPRLQECAMKSYLQQTTRKDLYRVEDIIEELLKSSLFNEMERDRIYKAMNSIYQEKRCVMGLQLLWMHLKDIPAYNDFLQQSVMQYFNIELSTELRQATFSELLNKVLRECSVCNSHRESMLQDLEIAHQTKLASLIDAEFLSSQKDSIIFDEKAPFKERAVHLDQRLMSMSSSDKLIEFFQALDANIIDSDFRSYIHHIYINMLIDSSSYATLKAKKELKILHKKYGIPGSVPQVVWNISRDIPNFSATQHRAKKERPKKFIALDRIIQPYISTDGFIYGFGSNNGYLSLWAIESKKLNAIWEIPLKISAITFQKNLKFIVQKDTIYLQVEDSIRSFDRFTGTELKSYSLKDGFKLISMHKDATELLYLAAIKDDTTYIMTININTGESQLLEYCKNSKWKKYFTAGKVFGYYNAEDRTLLIHCKDGSKNTISLCDDRDYFDPHITLCNSTIFFAKRMGIDQRHQLCSYDTEADVEQWLGDLPDGVMREFCVSKDGKAIYSISEDGLKVSAIKSNDSNFFNAWIAEMPNLDSSFKGVHEISISPDGKKLYALNTYNRKMYAINTENGAIISTDQCNVGRSQHLFGVSDKGIPYIQTT